MVVVWDSSWRLFEARRRRDALGGTLHWQFLGESWLPIFRARCSVNTHTDKIPGSEKSVVVLITRDYYHSSTEYRARLLCVEDRSGDFYICSERNCARVLALLLGFRDLLHKQRYPTILNARLNQSDRNYPCFAHDFVKVHYQCDQEQKI